MMRLTLGLFCGVFCGVTLLLSACTHLRYTTGPNDYLADSVVMVPLRVPAKTIAPKRQPYYALPRSAYALGLRAATHDHHSPVLLPPGMQQPQPVAARVSTH